MTLAGPDPGARPETDGSARGRGELLGAIANVTLKDVARVAGVHPATVSRALDPGKMWLVRPETRAKVQSAARELGYRTDVVARSLRRGQTTTVGIVVADLTLTFLAPVLRGITDALERHGFIGLISETQDDHERLRTSLENLLSRRVDAAILTGARLGDAALLEGTARERVPVVLAVRALPGSNLPAVTTDDDRGGYIAATHLAALGHRRVAELPGPSDVQPFLDRSEGFARAAAESGLDVLEFGEHAIHPTPAEGRRLMELLLARRDPRPTAVFAQSDSMAIGALDALRATGLRCPADMSILGYNDAPLVDHFDPPLSTIRLPSAEIGRFAAELAIALIEEPKTAVASMTFPPELVVRASTAPPPVPERGGPVRTGSVRR
jgi:LacI family transcriptional regulator, galactose operon repressor